MFLFLSVDHTRDLMFIPQALKLAERTIQFADTLTIFTEGHLRAGRVCHAEGSHVQAKRFYSAATSEQPKHVLGAIGLAQVQLQHGTL
jgi:RNA polymerase-associated protein CTR9